MLYHIQGVPNEYHSCDEGQSEGVLLLHHHNTLRTRAEVGRLADPPTAPEYRVLVPVAAR